MGVTGVTEIPFSLIVASIVLVAIFNAFMLSYAANYMDIGDVTFAKCIIISLSTGIIAYLLSSSPAHFLPFGLFGKILGWVIGAVIITTIIKFILNTEWDRAFWTYIAMIIVSVIARIILAVLLSFCCLSSACFLAPALS